MCGLTSRHAGLMTSSATAELETPSRVACSDLKLSKALVGFVIILGDERGVFKHPPLH